MRTDITPGRVEISSSARRKGRTLPTTALGDASDDGVLVPKLIGLDRYGSEEGSDQQGSTEGIGCQYVDKSPFEQGAKSPKALSGMDVKVATSTCV